MGAQQQKHQSASEPVLPSNSTSQKVAPAVEAAEEVPRGPLVKVQPNTPRSPIPAPKVEENPKEMVKHRHKLGELKLKRVK